MSGESVLSRGLRRYFSAGQLEALRAARVGIAGAGGLGSNCAMALVRSGLRRLVLADMDRVESSNLNRQFFFPEQAGRLKVDALAENLLRLEPGLDLELFPQELTPDNLGVVFAGCGVVVEALDRPEAKAMLLRGLLPGGAFLVCASGLGGIGGPAMSSRPFGKNAVIVGDGSTETDADNPPCAPRVLQAAALQADAVLAYILNTAVLPNGATPAC